jgi:hypothetical protein
MVNIRHITAPDEKTPATTFYIPTALKLKHRDLCKNLKSVKSQSERIRFLMERDLAEYDGKEIVLEYDIVGNQEARLKLKEKTDKLYKILKTETSANNHRSSYEVMVVFAKSFGLSDPLNNDVLIEKLQLYEFKGDEPFNSDTLLTFIHFLEASSKKRRIEVEITEYWRNRNLKKNGGGV